MKIHIQGIVRPGEKTTLAGMVDKASTLDRIKVSPGVANSFICREIRIGKEPILTTSSNISLSIFMQDETQPFFKHHICMPDSTVEIDIVNITDTLQHFEAEVHLLNTSD